MARTYIDNDMAHFTRTDIALVDMELFDGRKFCSLEPRRLFPLSGLEKYITLLDREGEEVAIIRDLRTLPPNERKIIEECLAEYYLIPKITKIDDLTEKFGMLTMYAQTDRGEVKIEMRGIIHSLKLLYGKRVLVRDTNDNRYEIPDITALDKKSRKFIDSYL